ncbi:hypothetical protein TWF481_010491 [Arthrobotrys musiformis]|uniref:Rhodopsin domain-containing protein n=1 Tax=Arthrobotrys musiformis TaxID=47236 RepID=A0AAV9W343_9PEZI
MSRVPSAEVIASWPEPNYSNPANRGHYLIAVEVVLFFFTAVVVVGRIYTRRWLIRSFGVDDWLIIPACIFCFALTVSTCLATTAGYGLHIYDVPHHLRTKSLEYAWANMLIYCITVTLTKLSILAFYLRLFPSGFFRTLTYITGFVVIASGVAYTFMVIFYCLPIRAYWQPFDFPDAKCLNDGYALVSNAAVNIALDSWLWIMPLPVVCKVHLPVRQRVGLIGVFALGFFVCIAGALRLYYVAITAYSYDKTWDGFNAWIWTALESDVGIICASLPALKPLVTKVTKFKFSEVTPTGYGNEHSRATKNPINNNRKSGGGGIRLPSRAASRNLGSRNQLTQLESIWDGSDEVICETEIKGGFSSKIKKHSGEDHGEGEAYQMSTIVFTGDPDGKLAAARKSYFDKALASKENLAINVRPTFPGGHDMEDRHSSSSGSSKVDLEEGRRSDENFNNGNTIGWKSWEIMRTTEIEVREDHNSFEEVRNLSTESLAIGRAVEV